MLTGWNQSTLPLAYRLLAHAGTSFDVPLSRCCLVCHVSSPWSSRAYLWTGSSSWLQTTSEALKESFVTLWNTASQGGELALPILDLLHRLLQQNPGVPPAGQGLQGENKESVTASDSQPAAAAPPESLLQYLFAKSKPPSPPKESR